MCVNLILELVLFLVKSDEMFFLLCFLVFFYSPVEASECSRFYSSSSLEHQLRELAQVMVVSLDLLKRGRRANFSFTSLQRSLLTSEEMSRYLSNRFGAPNAFLFRHISSWIEYIYKSGDSFESETVEQYLLFLDDIFRVY
jgi:hypothetical protein